MPNLDALAQSLDADAEGWLDLLEDGRSGCCSGSMIAPRERCGAATAVSSSGRPELTGQIWSTASN